MAVSDEKDKDTKIDKNSDVWLGPALSLFGKLTPWLIAPVVIGLTLGKWLDRKYGSEPWLFLAVTGVAFILSMIGLVKNALEEFKKIEDSEKKDDNHKLKK